MTRWTLISAAFLVAAFAVGAWGYAVLPANAQIALHFNAAGVANGFAGKAKGLFLLPAISAAVIATLIFAPPFLPRARNPVSMAGPYGIVVGGVAGVLFASQAAVVVHAMDSTFDVLRAAFLASGVLLIVVGNYLGKVRQNWLIGIRTPWTLTNETVWDKTHRFTGRLMFLAGVALVPISAFVPDHRWLIALMVTCAAGPMVVGAIYSAMIFPRPSRP